MRGWTPGSGHSFWAQNALFRAGSALGPMPWRGTPVRESGTHNGIRLRHLGSRNKPYQICVFPLGGNRNGRSWSRLRLWLWSQPWFPIVLFVDVLGRVRQ